MVIIFLFALRFSFGRAWLLGGVYCGFFRHEAGFRGLGGLWFT